MHGMDGGAQISQLGLSRRVYGSVKIQIRITYCLRHQAS